MNEKEEFEYFKNNSKPKYYKARRKGVIFFLILMIFICIFTLILGDSKLVLFAIILAFMDVLGILYLKFKNKDSIIYRQLYYRMSYNKKLDNRIVIIGIAMIILIYSLVLVVSTQKASEYTEAEHMQRVTERIKAKYIDGDEKLRPYDKPTDDGVIYPNVKAIDFTIYPLYDENDILKYFLVEFQPFGFLYVLIRDEQPKAFSWLGGSTSMYMLSSVCGEPTWTPYTIDNENGIDEIWETDVNGKEIVYTQSPFSVRGIENEKRYLLHLDGHIPAIKRESKFINLISNSEFEVLNGQTIGKQAIASSVSFINKKYFDL